MAAPEYSRLWTCRKRYSWQSVTSREKARSSPVLQAVRQATSESRAAFEVEYGTITPKLHIAASVEQGGWVEVYRLEADGTITKVRHEKGTPEAERLREEVATRAPCILNS